MSKQIKIRLFSISDFDKEEKWLTKMQKEGLQFCSTTGYTYTFTECPKEEWIYRLDLNENATDKEAYIQMYQDYGWEYVCQYGEWYYFRKKKAEDKSEDFSIFSDAESKIAMCKRVMHSRLRYIIPLYLVALVYNYMLHFTEGFRGHTFFSGFFEGMGMGLILVAVLLTGYFIVEFGKLNHMVKELENPIREK